MFLEIKSDTEKEYTGGGFVKGMPAKDRRLTRTVRKVLGLPFTKQLIYYPDIHDATSVVNVISFRIIEIGSSGWFTLELLLEDNRRVEILSWYFSEMQRTDFLKIIEKIEDEKED